MWCFEFVILVLLIFVLFCICCKCFLSEFVDFFLVIFFIGGKNNVFILVFNGDVREISGWINEFLWVMFILYKR